MLDCASLPVLLRFSPRVVGWVVLASSLGVLRCASDDAGKDAAGASGGAGSERPRDRFDLDLGGGGSGGQSPPALHSLCRPDLEDGCIPDHPDSCEPFAAAGAPGTGGAGAEDPGAGGPSEGGMGGQLPFGAAGAPGDEAPSREAACHLVREERVVVRACLPAGEGELGAPCLSPVHCAPGYTCVGEGASGLCQPYCCLGDSGSCGTGTYCAPRRVVGAEGRIDAPVCVRADQCKLSEESSCPGGGTACVPVRADGTTSCVQPGVGQKGDACDGPLSCSHGHVCSLSRGCLELCSTVSTQSQCAEGEFCQALAGFSDDVGVCIALER